MDHLASLGPKALIRIVFAFALVLTIHRVAFAQSQPPAPPQPLNASISDYGTTFIFSPPPICSKCLETELGFQSVTDGRYIPTVITVAPFKTATDFSVLINLLDSESPGNDRTTHFGNRFDFVARQQVMAKGGFTLVAAPRGTIFVRGTDGGRAGATAAPQYSWGKNVAAANITWTGGIDTSTANPRSDYVGAFDYFRALDTRGTGFFLGLQHEYTAGQQTIGTEEGLIIPFRNGQVELETAQLDLNVKPAFQFQARVIVNWGAVFGKK
jgi:hypothetical protein